MARDHRGRSIVDRGVEYGMRMSVASQEALQAHQIGGSRHVDKYRPPDATVDQQDASQDERAHDPFAELGLGNHHGAKRLGIFAPPDRSTNMPSPALPASNINSPSSQCAATPNRRSRSISLASRTG